jgi:hypothetical protein
MIHDATFGRAEAYNNTSTVANGTGDSRTDLVLFWYNH